MSGRRARTQLDLSRDIVIHGLMYWTMFSAWRLPTYFFPATVGRQLLSTSHTPKHDVSKPSKVLDATTHEFSQNADGRRPCASADYCRRPDPAQRSGPVRSGP